MSVLTSSRCKTDGCTRTHSADANHILSQLHQMPRYSITIAAMVVADDASRVYVAEQSRSEETLTADSCKVRASTYAIAYTQATALTAHHTLLWHRVAGLSLASRYRRVGSIRAHGRRWQERGKRPPSVVSPQLVAPRTAAATCEALNA